MIRNVRYAEWMDWLCLRFNERFAESDSSQSQADELSQKVREALDRLDSEEKEALELFHFLGRSIEEISVQMNLSQRGVGRLLRSGSLKLRRLLAAYAQKRFGITSEPVKRCPICHTQKRAEAEKIVISKSPRETWRRVIRELREELDITVGSPQTLVGHMKYHRLEEFEIIEPE